MGFCPKALKRSPRTSRGIAPVPFLSNKAKASLYSARSLKFAGASRPCWGQHTSVIALVTQVSEKIWGTKSSYHDSRSKIWVGSFKVVNRVVVDRSMPDGSRLPVALFRVRQFFLTLADTQVKRRYPTDEDLHYEKIKSNPQSTSNWKTMSMI